MITLNEIIQAWNSFFYNPIPIYTVAIFRILFGFILICDAFFILAHAQEYLGPDGLIGFDRYYKRNKGHSLSLFLYLPPTTKSVYLIIGLHIIFLFFMFAGL